MLNPCNCGSQVSKAGEEHGQPGGVAGDFRGMEREEFFVEAHCLVLVVFVLLVEVVLDHAYDVFWERVNWRGGEGGAQGLREVSQRSVEEESARWSQQREREKATHPEVMAQMWYQDIVFIERPSAASYRIRVWLSSSYNTEDVEKVVQALFAFSVCTAPRFFSFPGLRWPWEAAVEVVGWRDGALVGWLAGCFVLAPPNVFQRTSEFCKDSCETDSISAIKGPLD